jgi:cytochrome c peroxidase
MKIPTATGGTVAAFAIRIATLAAAAAIAAAAFAASARAPEPQQTPPGLPTPAERPTSYMKVDITEDFSVTLARMRAAREGLMQRQRELLAQRYDLANRPSGATMFRGKPVQGGVRVKLPPGASWQRLAELSPYEIRARDLFPASFLPLPHPNHAEGGMLFPHFEIDEIKRQEQRDLTRFDLDFDLPDHFLPEFPAPIFLTTRPDLGDVSGGQLLTIDNFHGMFNGLLNPKQLEGLRLLLTPFPQQQFNQTEDRRSKRPSRGVACLDCHSNGHSNDATHLVGDIRPQIFRHRIDAPTLRGVNIQRLFGSQRALKTVEDFTEFEQRAAYFDGAPVIATKKESPPYLHDGRLLTLEDTVEFFNLILETRLGDKEKADPTAFLRTL